MGFEVLDVPALNEQADEGLGAGEAEVHAAVLAELLFGPLDDLLGLQEVFDARKGRGSIVDSRWPKGRGY